MSSITKKSRRELYADKFAFGPDDTIPINALDLITELVEQDRLASENKMLRSKIETLETLLIALRATHGYTTYDIKGHLQ